MSRSLQTAAFVLRTVAYGESDVVVTLLGRETGRVTALARGARVSKKRFAGGLQPLRCLEASLVMQRPDSMANLQEIEVLRDYAGLEASFEKIAAASYLTELVREVAPEGQADPELFDLLADFFGYLTDAPQSPALLEAALRHAELRLLEIGGNAPALEGCARCACPVEELGKLAFSRTGEGLLCEACRAPTEPVGVVSPETLHLLCRYARQVAPESPEPSPEAVAQARRVIAASLRQVLPNELKSLSTLQSLGLA